MIKLTKSQLIEDLRHGVYARVMPSPIGGVGVFAIRDIPAGIDPFGEDDIEVEKISVSEIRNDPEIPDTVKKYAEDMCVVNGGYFYVPICGLNNINPGFFPNHSATPNMKTNDAGESFITLREIKIGEELMIDYNTYNDDVVL